MPAHRLRGAPIVRACVLLCLALATGLAAAQNAVQIENARTNGVTPQWLIADADYAANAEIEGYASATSVDRGESIHLFVQSAASETSHTIHVYRVGWYGGAGGRFVAGPFTRPRTPQPACPMTDAATRLVECDWTDPYVLATGSDWTSGVYLAKLTALPSGRQSYIVFVVRDDARTANILFQTAVTTYAAYNNWGGHNFYGSDSTGGQAAQKVSFDRPYRLAQRHANGKGAGDFLSWEINMLRFLEREGFDVKYATNIDTHAAPARLRTQRMFLSAGHDEYYTREMFDAVTAARDAGVHLGFFGANNIYWQSRLERGTRNGRAHRVLVGYKYEADPIVATDPSRATYTWRDTERAGINRPEAALMGVMYDYNTVRGDIVIDDCPAWICAGANVARGDVLPGLLGYEVDRIDASSPARVQVIATSPYDACLDAGCNAVERRHANVTFYAAASGAGVFATGSMQWAWGLDAFASGTTTWGDDRHGDLSNPAAQAITRNVLTRFSAATSGFPPHVTSAPGTAAVLGVSYAYVVAAIDPDGDALAFSLIQAPPGMAIDPVSGQVAWTPGPGQAGDHVITVQASDPGGLFASQTFTLSVRTNGPPQILSTPVTTGRVGVPYSATIAASDPDGDGIAFALARAPEGMTIDMASGVITWTPAAAQGGSQDVTVRVADAVGLAITQSFTIQVAPVNVAPRITSHPSLNTRIGTTYGYDVDAVDPNHEPVIYALVQAPPGMSINPATGLVLWQVSGVAAGPVPVTVRASDVGGLVAMQSFVLQVDRPTGLFGGLFGGLSGASSGGTGAATTTSLPATSQAIAPAGATPAPGPDSGGSGGGGCAIGGQQPVDPLLPLLASVAAIGCAFRRRQRTDPAERTSAFVRPGQGSP